MSHKLAAFLATAKQVIGSGADKFSAVLGNQSADLDSIASSIGMSYYLATSNSEQQQQQHTPTRHVVPLINSTRAILASKRECMLMLDHLRIGLDDLVFLEELAAAATVRERLVDLVLVDHNELDAAAKALRLERLVSGVVDHHLDKALFADAKPRLVEPSVGSCATLIAQLIQQLSSSSSSSSPASDDLVDEQLATLLLFPILSDTNNLTCRASQLDCDMAAYLTAHLKAPTTRDSLYARIEAAKFTACEQHETVSAVLQKDYKQYENAGRKWAMSSVNFSVEQWLQRGGENGCARDDATVTAGIKQFMDERGLYFFGILSCFKAASDGEFRRDMALFGATHPVEQVAQRLLADHSTQLTQLTPHAAIAATSVSSCRCAMKLYAVGDVKLTRKYWQPALEAILKSLPIS